MKNFTIITFAIIIVMANIVNFQQKRKLRAYNKYIKAKEQLDFLIKN